MRGSAQVGTVVEDVGAPEPVLRPMPGSGVVESAPHAPEPVLRPMPGVSGGGAVESPDKKEKATPNATMLPTFDSLPFGTGLSGGEPLGMKFSELGVDTRSHGHDTPVKCKHCGGNRPGGKR